MSTSRTTWLARGLWIVTMLFTAAGFVMGIANPVREGDVLFVPVGFVLVSGYASFGALIASRHPRNAIGWLLMGVALIFALNIFAEEYLTRAHLDDPDRYPGTTLLAWINGWTWALALGAIPLVLLLFPTGAPPSPRWRPAVWVVAFSALGALGLAISPGPVGPQGAAIPNPLAIDGALPRILGSAGAVAAVVGAFAAVLALVVRFRRARSEERQQLRWLAYVASAVGAIFAASLLAEPLVGPSAIGDWLFTAFFVVLGVGIPAACGVAILRYRLYELDLVVKKTVIFALLAGFVALAYVAVAGTIGVVALGASNAMAIFAIAFLLGAAFGPVRRQARRLADRVVYGRRASPYEVLTRFTERVGGAYAADDVLARMAHILAEGTGARAARVWLRVGNELRAAATWPEGAQPPPTVAVHSDLLPALPGGEDAFEVRDGHELLGALSLSMPSNDPMDPSKERLARDLASQAGLVLRNVRLIEELRASRQRLVAAQDEERRRLERNIHDGAQQQLVSLGVRMRLLDALIERDPAKARDLLSQLQADTAEALDDLRDLARGIYPPLLADRGLVEALEAQARRSALPVEVRADEVGRYGRQVEAAVYFCVLEALQNVVKHAGATKVELDLRQQDGELVFAVRDDGHGFDASDGRSGSGLQGMADRLDALRGRLIVRSEPGAGTVVEGRVPLGAQAGFASAQADSSRSGPNADFGM